MISEWTKAALAVRKAAGVKLGRPKGTQFATPEGRAKTIEVRQAKADAHAQLVARELENLARKGIVSANAAAKALNEQGVRTPRGGKWAARSVCCLGPIRNAAIGRMWVVE